MRSSILSILLLLSPALTRAASVVCSIDLSFLFGDRNNPVSVADAQCLLSAFQSKSLGDSFTFSSEFSGSNTEVAFECRSLRICVRNPFIFEGTTVSSDEMASLTQMILDCGTLEDGSISNIDSGKVTGDTGLEIDVFTTAPGGGFDVAIQLTQC